MKFIEVAKAFDEIEKVSSRLKITQLLADLLKKSNPEEAGIISYMSLGELNPTYVGTQFNFAEKSMIKVLAKLLDKSESTIKSKANKLGDLGLIVLEEKSVQENFTVLQINRLLQTFLSVSGKGSIEEKEKSLLKLLKEVDPICAKYIVRIILGKLRLGFSDMTLLDAFSWMEVGDKSIRKELEEAYNVCVDIGHIIKILKEKGINGIKKINIIPGIPIRPAAAERLSNAKAIVKKLGSCIAQPKLDGFRLQIHINNKKGKKEIHFFSRNLQDMSDMFPDLKKAVSNLSVKTLVGEGEAIAFDVQTGTFLPFQETVKRKRKYDIEKMSKDFPLKLYFFDLLFLNGESFLDKTHQQRRKKLVDLFETKKIKEQEVVFLIEEEKIDSDKELEDYFEQNISIGLEGLVVKKSDAIYQPGKRNFNWVKLKRQESGQLKDSIDCVILGYYAGKGKRAAFGIGAILVGIFNKKEDCFQTVAKIGTGFSDNELKELKKKCDKISVKTKPKNVECAKELYPTIWVSPEIVCIILADEITLSPLHTAGSTKEDYGMALRFPRFMEYCTDKSAEDSTSVKELKSLYTMQFTNKTKKGRKGKTKKKNKVENKTLSLF